MLEREQLVGAWRLVSAQERTEDGQTFHPYGPEARGLLIYLPSGLFSAQLMDERRPHFRPEVGRELRRAEIREAYQGFLSYWGRWELAGDGEQVRHFVDGSLYPNWIGGEQVRLAELDGERLVLRTPPLPYRGRLRVFELAWERVE